MSEHTERRHFKRIAFDAPAELSQGDRKWPVNLLDVSLKGVLIESPECWDGDRDQLFHLQIDLDKNAKVSMQAQLRHKEDTQLGFVWVHIDLASMEHLRRLIELNLADRTELQHEFLKLIEV